MTDQSRAERLAEIRGRRLLAALAAAEARTVPEGWKLAPWLPTEEMWGGLARQIVMWARNHGATGAALYRDLALIGMEAPAWLREDIRDIEHVPPKGDIAVAIYHAMLSAAPQPPQGGWQSIDTAPDDEELLLGWWQTTCGPEGKRWKQEVGVAHDTRGRWFHGCATYWQPLPSPPQPADAGKE